MKPFMKRLLGLGGGLVSALVLVALAVLLFCDLSSLRGRIERHVSSTLNREVTIAGDIRLMPMLPPRVELEDVRVSAGISSPGDDLARMGSVQVTLSTAHLMRATVILEHIQVSNFELFAVREADGLWRLPMPAADDLDDGVLESVVLQDGTVKLIDHASAREHQLEISTLDLVFSDAQLESRFAGALDGHRLEGRLQADSLSTLSGESPWQFALEIDALRWTLSAEGARESPTVWQGHIEAETESVGVVSNLLGVALPSLGPFQALADVRYDLGGARVSNFELHARSTYLRGHAQLDLTRDRPILDVSVTSDSVDVGHWMNAAPTESGGVLSAPLDKDLPLTFLSGLGLDVAAQVAVDSVIVDEHQLGPVNVKAFSSSASAGLQGSIDLWGGRLDLDLDFSLPEDGPEISIKLGAENLRTAAVAGLLPVHASGSGTVSGAALLSARGHSMTEVMASLSGEIAVAGAQIELEGTGERAILVKVERAASKLEQGKARSLSISGAVNDQPARLAIVPETTLAALLNGQPSKFHGEASVAGFEFSAKGLLATPFSKPNLDIGLDWSGSDVGVLLSLMGYPSESLPGSEGSAALSLAQHNWNISSLFLTLGGSHLRGQVVGQQHSDKLVIAGAFDATSIAFDELREVFQRFAGAAATRSVQQPEKVVEVLLELDIEHLSGAAAELQDLNTRMHLASGMLSFDPLRFSWEEAQLTGHMSVDLSPDQPQITAELSVQPLDMSKLPFAYSEGFALTGTVEQVDVSFSATGVDMPEWRQSLAGQVSLSGGDLTLDSAAGVTTIGAVEAQLNLDHEQPLLIAARGNVAGSVYRLDGHVNTLQLLHNNQPIDVEVELQGPAFELDIVGTVERLVQFDRAAFSAEFAGEHAEHIGILIGVPEWVSGPFSGQGQVSIENGQVQVSALELAVAETDIKGDIGFPFRDPGVVNGNLHSERVTVPDLWEPAAQSGEDEGAEFVIPALALGELASLHRSVALDWRIDRLWLAASSYRDVNSSISISDGVMDLRISGTTNHTDGRFSLVFTHDPDRARSGELNASGESFDFGWLLPDTGLGKPRWPADYDVILTGPGERLDLFLGDADGEIHFISGPTDGAEFKRWDLNLLTLMLPSFDEAPRDQLLCMVLNAELDEGVASTGGLVAETESILIAGGGMVDLRSEKLGLLVSAKPRDKTLTGVTVPLKVEGTLANPEFTPASNELLLKASTLLLGVANPIVLIGGYVFSQVNDSNRCESGLQRAREEYGVLTSIEIESSSGFFGHTFDFLTGRGQQSGDSKNLGRGQTRLR